MAPRLSPSARLPASLPPPPPLPASLPPPPPLRRLPSAAIAASVSRCLRASLPHLPVRFRVSPPPCLTATSSILFSLHLTPPQTLAPYPLLSPPCCCITPVSTASSSDPPMRLPALLLLLLAAVAAEASTLSARMVHRLSHEAQLSVGA
ncbi:hypothetical protein GUJ93_ZPchr0004g39714 [Zizania palustris]|uniref:Uncharacterized protein n=1 Tax=Zizania palustris TaxID=103762 RepID=A0A8J5V9C9_ZIZPA|nr:hypothetical protein GUJ93_ZPchr0004g39714 [Zizania palustris]